MHPPASGSGTLQGGCARDGIVQVNGHKIPFGWRHSRTSFVAVTKRLDELDGSLDSPCHAPLASQSDEVVVYLVVAYGHVEVRKFEFGWESSPSSGSPRARTLHTSTRRLQLLLAGLHNSLSHTLRDPSALLLLHDAPMVLSGPS